MSLSSLQLQPMVSCVRKFRKETKNTCHLATTSLQERKLTMRRTQDTGPGQLGRISQGPLRRIQTPASSRTPCCGCLVTESWVLRDPRDYSLPGSSVHGISLARILEWIAISSSRGSSQPGDQTHVSCISRQILYH